MHILHIGKIYCCVHFCGIENGHSFLEIGCGVGQNLIKIKEKFPESLLFGCDISKYLNVASEKFKFLNLKKINILNTNELFFYKDSSIDHVFLMHVLEHVTGENIEATNKLRREIFNHAIRISRNSVMISGGMKEKL